MKICNQALLTIRESVKDVAPEGGVTIGYEIEKARCIIDKSDITEITAKMPQITQTTDGNGGFQIKSSGGDTGYTPPVLAIISRVVQEKGTVIPPSAVRGLEFMEVHPQFSNGKTLRHRERRIGRSDR